MRLALLAAATLFVCAAAAHADTISTYNLTNTTLSDGGVLTGTLSIDTTTGTYEAGSFTLLDGGRSYLFNTLTAGTLSFDNNTQVYTNYSDGNGDVFVLDLPGLSLVNYAGGNLCSLAHPCNNYFADVAFASGSVVAVANGALAVTPEPSSFALLGTGLLGVAGIVRKRLV